MELEISRNKESHGLDGHVGCSEVGGFYEHGVFEDPSLLEGCGCRSHSMAEGNAFLTKEC